MQHHFGTLLAGTKPMQDQHHFGTLVGVGVHLESDALAAIHHSLCGWVHHRAVASPRDTVGCYTPVVVSLSIPGFCNFCGVA